MAHTIAILNGKEPSAGNGGVSDADLSNLAVNFFTSGVVGADDYEVEQQVTPNMTVLVNTGKAYVPSPSGDMLYHTELDTAANVTITNNASGNPRKDAIVIKVDLAVTPNEFANNVATLVAVPGTPAASPVAPTDSAIQTAVGAGNAFLRLANIDVANGAVSISTANISDARVRVKATLGEAALKFPDADGTAGQALKTDGDGNLSFSDVSPSSPGVRLTKSAAQSIPNSTWTAVTWDTETYDTNTMHDNATNNSRITFTTAGVYIISVAFEWALNGTGARMAAFQFNGGSREAQSMSVPSVDQRAMMNLSLVRKVAAGDYVEVAVLQASGGSLNLQASNGLETIAQFAAQHLGTGS